MHLEVMLQNRDLRIFDFWDFFYKDFIQKFFIQKLVALLLSKNNRQEIRQHNDTKKGVQNCLEKQMRRLAGEW